MNLDELQSARDRERRSDTLQQLRESFYAEAGEFIGELRERRQEAAERADDPFDAPEVNRLTDEIDTAEQTVESLHEKRVGKIVKAATLAATGMSAEPDGLTTEERDLFETLVGDVERNRERVLDALAGDATGSAESSGSEPEQDSEPESEPDPGRGSDAGVSAAEAMGETTDRGRADSADPEPATGAAGGDRAAPSETDAAVPDGADTGAERGGGPGRGAAGGERAADRRHEKPAGERGSGGESEPAVRKDGAAVQIDRETVRVTEDVGDIFGVDEREYDLSEDDVVRLPAANAGPLIERGAAERL